MSVPGNQPAPLTLGATTKIVGSATKLW